MRNVPEKFWDSSFFVLQTFTNRSRNLKRQKPLQNESNLRKKKAITTEIESPIKQVQGWRNVSINSIQSMITHVKFATKVPHKVDSRQNCHSLKNLKTQNLEICLYKNSIFAEKGPLPLPPKSAI